MVAIKCPIRILTNEWIAPHSRISTLVRVGIGRSRAPCYCTLDRNIFLHWRPNYEFYIWRIYWTLIARLDTEGGRCPRGGVLLISPSEIPQGDAYPFQPHRFLRVIPKGVVCILGRSGNIRVIQERHWCSRKKERLGASFYFGGILEFAKKIQVGPSNFRWKIKENWKISGEFWKFPGQFWNFSGEFWNFCLGFSNFSFFSRWKWPVFSDP